MPLLCVLAACGGDANDTSKGAGGKVTGGTDTHGALDDYAAELERGVDIRCGQCWVELGHTTEASCRSESKSDTLGKSQRECFDALMSMVPEQLTLYLQCQTAAAKWYDDCFAKDCDLRRCTKEHATWKPDPKCEGNAPTEDDAGTVSAPIPGVTQCDPLTDEQ
ncbi:MAG TPA: hypothetical protein VHM19_09625 [Polyangiales bacterium]|nr:hypothetical protein [Polyangiales bacterium]